VKKRRETSGSAPELDVAILGGGLAGNLLARQLRRTLPELRIGLFDRSTASSYKVGEATVEIAANYLIRKLGLSSYLYENQLPKNGLRYFFDDERRSLPLQEMSEIGTSNLPFHPAFQLNRARLEEDLLELNQRDGVQVRRGARVGAVELGEPGAPHAFEVSDERGKTRASARWIVDAAGRSGLLARRQGLRVSEPEHAIGSVWGRFESVVDIDTLGPEEFRARVRHTPRRLSTIHFCYPGYWIWFIPLRNDVTSVGVTGARVARDRELRRPEGFRAFLEEHRAVASLLAPAKLLDVGSYTRIAYGTRRFFDPCRWGLTGEAATSADPLYSPGSDFIALENDFLTDLIARDFAGEAPALLAERCDLYDRFMRFRHESTMLLYSGLYDGLGSFELAGAKWDFDIGSYYNLWVSAYMCDRHLDLDFLREQLRLRPFVLNVLRNFATLFQSVEGRLRERGEYFRGNAGRFYCGLDGIRFMQEVGTERSQGVVFAQAGETFNQVRAKALQILGEAESPGDVEPLPLSAFLAPRALV
jgi:flavin-dependent dehydrogenase